MSIIFSRRCEYAIRAIVYLAHKKDSETVSIREITNRLDIPYHYLSKILQDLARKKILKSQRGASGGYSLGRNTGDITLLKVVEAIDGEAIVKSCVLGFSECSSANPCSLHEQWLQTREEIQRLLETENMAGMAKRMRTPASER